MQDNQQHQRLMGKHGSDACYLHHQQSRRKQECTNQQQQQQGGINVSKIFSRKARVFSSPPLDCLMNGINPISSNHHHEIISLNFTSGKTIINSPTAQRRLNVIGKHLMVVSVVGGQQMSPSSCSATDNSSQSKPKNKKEWKETLMNMFHFSKWMLIVTCATPCLIITIFSRIVRNMTVGTIKNVIFPIIRLKERLMARYFKKSTTTDKEGMTLHEKEQRAKDYVVLTHLYLIHPIIVSCCKLFFWALFNSLTVLYESDIARNLKKLNAFEYYNLINEKNPNIKVTKTLSLKEEHAIREKGPFIYAIGNQRSLADGIVELAYKTQNSVTIMNIEMALFPFFGWISYGVGSEVIIRQIPKQSWEVLDNMRRLMKRGLFQTYIYPEGARQTSDSKELLPYKMGLFVLAIETQASIVPVIHYGVDDIWPYDDWKIYSGNDAYVVIGEPIETKGMVLNQRFELMEIYRQRIQEMIARMEERIRENKRKKK